MSELQGKRIMVLVSGAGTNLQALIDAEQAGVLPKGSIAAVLADTPGVYALERARRARIPALVEKPDKSLGKMERRQDLSERILRAVREQDAELIILAGFLSILQGRILQDYAGRILNLHPSLLPKFGGAGMYGEGVHRAVLAAGERESGCTVHLVNAGIDSGPMVLQRKVPVLEGDTPALLAERVHQEEHRAIVEAALIMLKRQDSSDSFVHREPR